ncbi:BTE_collapsed_G0019230.mRNA.1.CDS.1 [Saccharomyces cerevisiae]|nr:BTE_HP_G0045960.mRNA.1.CDS.1 [Saccharomyces cerevisiae]CAI5028443.1 BTE_HP_G0081610.mRNA.1.CDS.1 [Saccharomyces cerevisiae]CAI5097361.1 BTE_HP_G0107880.mRNA.1.CDS.1 [Saccharomyces cerevisiae]CAI5218128.1 BTE_HP_G0188780.mRNA.1.CDS.1 [Saccharomyces cerevisiae]CAI6840783.1 BTE_HP_G0045960.mRNA.1.CDS.1 [Saccharomyces cerevisiae]
MSSKWFNAIHLLVCPLTVLVGYLMNAYGYGAALQATLNKDGLVNAMLVKKGWFWTSLVGWWCIIRYRAVPGATGRDRRHIVQSFKRYAILTVWWYVFTQGIWFGVGPIMDLVFVYTGGHCHYDVFDDVGHVNEDFQGSVTRTNRALALIHNVLTLHGHHQEHRQQQLWDRSIGSIQGALQATQPKTPKNVTASAAAAINTFIHDQMHRWQGPLTTSAQCRRFGGHWAGGHDPSGHVFLATLMCMFLLGELRVFGRRALAHLYAQKWQLVRLVTRLFDTGPLWTWRRCGGGSMTCGARLWRAIVEPPVTCAAALLRLTRCIACDHPVIILLTLLVTWLWQLLLTAVASRFHTVREHMSGLLAAYIVTGLVYARDAAALRPV